MLLSKQIAGFFEDQYLWKELINIFDFLHGDIPQKRQLLRLVPLVGFIHAAQPRSDLLRLATNTFGWSRSMAKLKIVQKKISINSSGSILQNGSFHK